MKVRMQHLGRKLKPNKPSMEIRREEFPEINLTDDHMAGMESLQRGHKVALMFTGEVKGTRAHDTEYGKGLSVDFKLTHGHIEAGKKEKPALSMHDAKTRAIHASKGDHA